MWEIERERVWICVQWCWNMLRPFFKWQGSVKMFRPHRIRVRSFPWICHEHLIGGGAPQNQLWGYMGIIIPNRKQQMFQTTKKFLAPFELVSLDPHDNAFWGHLPSEPAQLNWCHDLPVGSMFLGDSMLLAMSHVAEGVTWCHLSQIVSKERMWIRVSSPWLPDFHIQNSHPGFHPGIDPSSTHSRALIPTV